MNVVEWLLRDRGGIYSPDRSRITFRCIRHEDRGRPNAVYYVNRGWWRCFRCHAGGRFNSLRANLLPATSVGMVNKPINYSLLLTKQKAFISNLFNRTYSFALVYLYKQRGLPLDVIKQYGLGFSPKLQGITIPYYSNNVLTGWKVRLLRPGKSRYLSAGYVNGLYLLNNSASTNSKSIAIYEGEFNAIVSRLFFPNLPAVAIGGASNINKLRELKEHYRRFYLCFDEDPAGEAAAKSAAAILGPSRCYKPKFDRGKDLNEYWTLTLADPKKSRLGAITAFKRAKLMGEPRLKSWDDGLKALIKSLAGGENVGISTGFPELDRLTGWFMPNTLNILTAQPGIGKTTLAAILAYNVSQLMGIPTAVYSYETHFKYAFAAKMVSYHLKRNISTADKVDANELRDIYIQCCKFKNIQWLDHRGAFHGDIMLDDIRQAYDNGARFLVFDHLQLMTRDPRDREGEVTKLINDLRELKEKLPRVTMLITAQIVRQEEKNSRIALTDLYGGAIIEQNADSVVAIDVVGGARRLRLLKQRSDAVTTPILSECLVKFDPQTFVYQFEML